MNRTAPRMMLLVGGLLAASVVLAATPAPMPSARQLASTKPAPPRPKAPLSGVT